MGDFNFRNINWETGECTSAREQKFLDTHQDNLLVQMVDSPTKGPNILDFVLVSRIVSLERLLEIVTIR